LGKFYPILVRDRNHKVIRNVTFLPERLLFLVLYEGGPKQTLPVALLPALENRRIAKEIAKEQFFTGSKISKAWLQSSKLFLPRRLRRYIVVEEKFLYFFYLFLFFLAVKMTVSFLQEQM